ncbi:type II toxin-antitoxin system RelE/ParE family toxin [Zwartia vadi]|uniref:type II toxin-antitoxin system RelE/ParE family toxin n=1 Tax=Zwartia vadi TaxID=3058168 RepID=UPI0025B4D701|nr:type II toxin-antitoxin system RelE/ParE family toxin [Zwartia vadi]MDN3988206.1 type II toxin-antitoxin system RelE/ParE family toxin [Zwartia vadi]
MYRLKHYVNSSGDDLFGAWLDSVIDIRTRSRIAARLVRLNNGNFGDCKPVGEGVWELRVDTGPGYRIYYAIDNGKVILLCEGGDKRTQRSDIKRAIVRWQDWKERK